jgi:GAF domain-containing protein
VTFTGFNSQLSKLDLNKSARAFARAMADAALFLNEPAEEVDTTLGRLAEVACLTIPAVDMASISVASREGISTRAATDDTARELDQLQYDLQNGPCVDALLDPDKREVVVGDLSREDRWPRYGKAAADHGFRSQMGIQIYREGRTAGGLNLYSKQVNAFDDETRAAAEIYAVHAALALDKAREVTALNSALATRQVIGQAVGIVMRTYTVDENAAFNYLVRVSQATNTKVREVAARVVGAVVEQANA